MINLAEYIENAPKPFLNATHKRIGNKGGLVQNSKIVGEVLEWCLSEERVRECISQLDPTAKTLLGQIYLSGERGVSFKELKRYQMQNGEYAPATQSGAQVGVQQRFHLEHLIWDFLCTQQYNDYQSRYCGFQEIRPFILEMLEEEYSHPQPGKDFQSYAGFFRKHLLSLCALVIKQKAKINADSTLYKRTVNRLIEKITFAKGISEMIPEEEADLQVRAIMHLRLVANYDDTLKPTPFLQKFLSKNPSDQEEELIRWWQEEHKISNKTLRLLLRFFTTERSSLDCVKYLWVYDAQPVKLNTDSPETGFSWGNLPLIVQEMWLLGLLGIHIQSGMILSIKLSTQGERLFDNEEVWLESEYASPPIGTPDFQALVPISNPGDQIFLLELCGESLNDDPLCKYKLTRDSFVQGISLPQMENSSKQILQWFQYIGSVHAALEEWYNSVFSSRIFRPLLFHIKDAARLEELSGIPQVMELVEENIPGYGFIIKEEHEEKFLELIGHLGLEPPKHEDSYDIIPSTPQLPPLSWTSASLTDSKLEYKEETPSEEVSSSNAGTTKYSNEFQKLAYNEILQVIRYANLMDCDIQLKMNPHPKTKESEEHHLSSVYLNSISDPLRLCGIPQGSGSKEELEINVNDIDKIRIMEDL